MISAVVFYGTEFYRAVTAAMYGPYLLPAEVLYYSPEPTRGEIWGQIGDYVFLYAR